MKLISIITVTYNSAETVEETIKSVLSQKTEAVEYIIIDGCSTDNTLEIVKKYEKDIDIIVSEKDQGISDAFNKGIGLAHGQIIALLNSDDILNKGAVECLINNYEPGIDMYRGRMAIWNCKTGEKRHIEPAMDLLPHCHKIYYAHPSTYITKSAYEKYGLYDIKCKVKMDIDLLMRMAIAGASMKYIPFEFVDFREGGVSTRRGRDFNVYKKSLGETMYIYDKNKVGLLPRIYDFIRLSVKFILGR
ncbi:MAG: glycosyltransferase [Lachnospiraceae bacterium]|nr:glycosyltransferase [Lachnospiraceae bacterium]